MEKALNELFTKLHNQAIDDLEKIHREREKELEWEFAEAEAEAEAEAKAREEECGD